MSITHALIIKNNKISFHSAHYNKIIQIINTPKPNKFLDAGYIIIDFDNKTIINAQNAFSINHLNNKEIKKMSILTL